MNSPDYKNLTPPSGKAMPQGLRSDPMSGDSGGSKAVGLKKAGRLKSPTRDVKQHRLTIRNM